MLLIFFSDGGVEISEKVRTWTQLSAPAADTPTSTPQKEKLCLILFPAVMPN
jgi:hypothetical protein